MKMYCEANSMRIVGKAWEVRTKLRQLANQNVTLSEWLSFTRSERTAVKNRPLGTLRSKA